MTKKRIGIYNRWLTTLGGGEKYSLTIAEYLSRFHHVEIISHKPVSRELAAERLHLDLESLHFNFIPELSVLELPQITKDYDLFINASYMDFYPCLAKLGAYIVYFPDKLSLRIGVRRALKQQMRTWLKMPTTVAGVCQFTSATQSFEWYLDSIFKMRLPPSSRAYRVRFDLTVQDPQVSKIALFVNDLRQDSIAFPAFNQPARLEVIVPPQNHSGELTILLEGETAQVGKARAKLANLDLDLLPYQIFRKVFENKYREWGTRLYYYSQAYAILDHIDTYQVLWTISEFTRKWTWKYWRRNSELLFPQVDFDGFRIGVKQRKILNVGRFFAGNHNKKHLEMVQAFKSMVDDGLKDWELHLVGNLAAGEEHKIYLDTVRQSAQGYPIVIHQDIPFQQLSDLYAESAIYWHASGYGEDEDRDPVKFEHFGITTVEAMASGCVPVVIGKGGQREIVNHGKNGFLWDTLEELKRYTLLVANDESLRNSLAQAATVSLEKFNRKNFEAQLDKVLERMET
jgi:glycosyltransferase involved in cell wall biosynthesis